MYKNKKFIVVEGPIGVGKTTLAKKLANSLDSEILLENFLDNPFLKLFYNDIERYALPTQLYFLLQRSNDFSKENSSGMNLAYGVREFPMGAINNGIAQHGGLYPFGATFFVFADYERPAVRLRALQGLPCISEYTHDSIYVGEDGPTHQPIEHLMSYRAIPNLLVLRPADANEAVIASKIAFEQKNRPSMVLLTRQGLPVFDRSVYPVASSIEKGGYVMCDHDNPDIMILATGSEVWIALEVAKMLSDLNIKVVNLACWELFEDQDSSYKENVLKCTNNTLIVSVEAGITDGWQKYTGRNGLNIGINTFGESAPGKVVAEHFKLTPEGVVYKIKHRMDTT